MRTKSIVSMLILTAAAVTFAFNDAGAGLPGLPGLPAPPGIPAPPGLPAPPGVNVSIDGFLPAPPGVHIQFDAGRPYYVERGRRHYLKKASRSRRHEGRGKKHGHYKRHGH